ncbi:UDP-galactose transporter [Venturia nashicola]|uniref:UDP-galactose transporter n=1 Tax=Venturia nashicola TaxID=86259 RepID=A0A4Z1NR32_9PEZI|nr:UDP-galactose transporter [Venturia nashicola]TLD26029.1 UDP-galactose transporter [Venturia nashicola]
MIDALGSLATGALIFGGCCSNVYALEAILKHEPDSGLLITLGQFIIVALSAYPSQSSTSPPFFLKKTKIPSRKLFFSSAMFFLVNMLNNWAFAFNISVPVHIILRSFGSVTTMAAGWLRGKRYTQLQVLSVVVLTAGVMISAWADAASKGKSLDTKVDLSEPSLGLGLIILFVAQCLGSWMGVYVQDVYAEHGTHWDENLFYSHLLSIPLFLPLAGTLRSQWASLANTPPMPALAYSPHLPMFLQQTFSKIPHAIINLAVNALTQLLCITGVNLLGATSSAVTVTIVLNVRKLVSFMLSIWLFGNKLSFMMGFGAFLVFAAGAGYGWETNVGMRRRAAKAKKHAETKGLNGQTEQKKEL